MTLSHEEVTSRSALIWQEVIIQFLVSEFISSLLTTPGSCFRSLYLRPQWVGVRRICNKYRG